MFLFAVAITGVIIVCLKLNGNTEQQSLYLHKGKTITFTTERLSEDQLTAKYTKGALQFLGSIRLYIDFSM